MQGLNNNVFCENLQILRTLTFSRVDVDPRPVEHLLVLPVGVPQDGLGAEEQNQSGAAAEYRGPGRAAPHTDVQRPETHSHQEAEAHAGDVQNPLGYHEAHVEKEVGGREEGDGQQAQRKDNHVLSGGQWSPALVVLCGTVLSVVVGVRVRVGVVVCVFVIAPMATVSVAVAVPGDVMRFAVGLLDLRRRVARPQAKPGQRQQPEVERRSVNIPPVSEGPDQRQGVHGPVKAQRIWEQEEPKVGGGQVEEGQRPGEERRRVGRRVVRVGEVGGFVAHPVESTGQHDDSPGGKQDHVEQQVEVLSLEERRETQNQTWALPSKLWPSKAFLRMERLFSPLGYHFFFC